MNNPFCLPYRKRRHISDSYKRFSERQIELFTTFFQPQILRGVFQCPLFLARQFGLRSVKPTKKSDFSNVIDMDEYENRITGFVVILIMIVVFQIYQAL